MILICGVCLFVWVGGGGRYKPNIFGQYHLQLVVQVVLPIAHYEFKNAWLQGQEAPIMQAYDPQTWPKGQRYWAYSILLHPPTQTNTHTLTTTTNEDHDVLLL